MEPLLEAINQQISTLTCPVHHKRAGVKLKARSLDFHIQACCEKFKTKIYKICQKHKLDFLKEESKKILKK